MLIIKKRDTVTVKKFKRLWLKRENLSYASRIESKEEKSVIMDVALKLDLDPRIAFSIITEVMQASGLGAVRHPDDNKDIKGKLAQSLCLQS